jgi:hypothetical protein
MAIKFSKVEPGMVLLDIHSYRMGNTTMRKLGKWDVRIISVDTAASTALVSWNGNRPATWQRRQIERLHTKETKAYRDQEARRAAGGWL